MFLASMSDGLFGLNMQTDPITGQIDLDLITTGAGQQQRRMRGDLKQAVSLRSSLFDIELGTDGTASLKILSLLDKSGRAGLRWQSAIKSLEEQSSVTIDATEFTDIIKSMEHEGVVKVVGERERRTIKRVSD